MPRSSFAEIESQTVRILRDVGSMASEGKMASISDPLSRTVWALAATVLEHYQMDFEAITEEMEAMESTTADCLSNYSDLLKRCVKPILDQKTLNWGRLITVFGIYIQFCRRIREKRSSQSAIFIQNEFPVDFGEFLALHVGHWVFHRGGWVRAI